MKIDYLGKRFLTGMIAVSAANALGAVVLFVLNLRAGRSVWLNVAVVVVSTVVCAYNVRLLRRPSATTPEPGPRGRFRVIGWIARVILRADGVVLIATLKNGSYGFLGEVPQEKRLPVALLIMKVAKSMADDDAPDDEPPDQPVVH